MNYSTVNTEYDTQLRSYMISVYNNMGLGLLPEDRYPAQDKEI